MNVVTLASNAGGLVCQSLSAALTVCRVLPRPVTAWDVFLMVCILGLLLTGAGTVFVYLDARTQGPPRRRATDRAMLPEVVPFIHFPARPKAPEDDHDLS